MSVNIDLLYETRDLIMIRYPRFASTMANTQMEYNSHLKYHTAATDGKKVYFDPNYFASIDQTEREFVMAHELLHKKYKHMFRLTDKNGEERCVEVNSDSIKIYDEE